MGNVFLEVVSTIESYDKAYEEAKKETEKVMNDVLVKLFAEYLFYHICGLVPLRNAKAEEINEFNDTVMDFLRFQEDFYHRSAEKLKQLVIKKSSDEEYLKAIREIETEMEELHRRAEKLQ